VIFPARFLSLLVLCCSIYGQEVCSEMSATYTQWGDTCIHGSFSAGRTYTVSYRVREAFWITPETLSRAITGNGECAVGLFQCNPEFSASITVGSNHRFSASRGDGKILWVDNIPIMCFTGNYYVIPDPVERPVVLCPVACG
jgi:hypothetical protein